MALPTPVADQEILGRRIISSRDARRASRNKIVPTVFIAAHPAIDISVDRIFVSFENEVLNVALDETPPDRNFYGWAKLTAKQAREMNCCVKGSPTCSNRFHADIILPSNVSGDTDAEIARAKELAEASEWLVRPDRSLDESLEESARIRAERRQRMAD